MSDRGVDSTVATLGFDADGARRWASSLGFEYDGRLSFRRVGLGKSNLTIEVRDDAGRRWILRRPPLGDLVQSAHDIEREAKILTALGPTEVPVPSVLGVCRDDSVSAAPMMLMDYVDGLVVESLEAATAVAPNTRREMSMSMPATLAKIHAVDLDATGLASLASHGPYAARQLRRWRYQWETVRTRDLPVLDELSAVLEENIPDQTETVLLHGDFHLRNLIYAPGSGEIAAVLDWELSTLGDPLADVGSLMAYWPDQDEIPSVLLDPAVPLFAASALAGFATRNELVHAYLGLTGRDASAIPFWHALGLWKLAIIGEGVLRRALDVPMNAGSGGSPAPEVVGALAHRALTLLSAS